MASLTPRFSADRAVREYTDRHYLPGAATYRERAAGNGAIGKQVVDWLDRSKTDLTMRNPRTDAGAIASMKPDFSDYVRADPDELNRILWSALRPGEPTPAPVPSHVRQEY